MSGLSNYHTHTVFCDGKDTPEELVREAIRLGCPELGFSGHAHVSFDGCCMTPEGTERYREEVLRLREMYRGKLRILLGTEQDYYSDLPTDGYDYVIGSVHYVFRDGHFLCVDESPESFRRNVEDHFGGDCLAFAEAYYALVAKIFEKTRCTVVGHFDLVTKFNEGGALFDTDDPRYRRAALSALDALADRPVLFEVNTGAVARGWRSTPYPEPWLLDEMIRRGLPLLLSSDCHDRRCLLYGLEDLRGLPGVRETLFPAGE